MKNRMIQPSDKINMKNKVKCQKLQVQRVFTQFCNDFEFPYGLNLNEAKNPMCHHF